MLAVMKRPALTFSWQAAVRDEVMLPAQPYRSLREQLKTGDLVLFSGRTLSSRLVRIFTGSRWSHIGMVVRLPDMPGTPLLWEATRPSKVRDIFRGMPADGVQLVPLDDRVLSYEGHVAIRRLQGVSPDAGRRRCLEQLMDAWRDRPYHNFVRRFFGVLLCRDAGSPFRRGGFCSELVAEVYRQWRLLPADRPAHHYVPRDFCHEEGHPQLRATLSPTCLLAT